MITQLGESISGESLPWKLTPYQLPEAWRAYAPSTYPLDGTGCQPYSPPTEERIREIIREELREALKGLKP
jgi:hypothetical protein